MSLAIDERAPGRIRLARGVELLGVYEGSACLESAVSPAQARRPGHPGLPPPAPDRLLSGRTGRSRGHRRPGQPGVRPGGERRQRRLPHRQPAPRPAWCCWSSTHPTRTPPTRRPLPRPLGQPAPRPAAPGGSGARTGPPGDHQCAASAVLAPADLGRPGLPRRPRRLALPRERLRRRRRGPPDHLRAQAGAAAERPDHRRRRLPRVRPRRRRPATAGRPRGRWVPASTSSGPCSSPTSPTPTASTGGTAADRSGRRLLQRAVHPGRRRRLPVERLPATGAVPAAGSARDPAPVPAIRAARRLLRRQRPDRGAQPVRLHASGPAEDHAAGRRGRAPTGPRQADRPQALGPAGRPDVGLCHGADPDRQRCGLRRAGAPHRRGRLGVGAAPAQQAGRCVRQRRRRRAGQRRARVRR